jgi:hypothetical protein
MYQKLDKKNDKFFLPNETQRTETLVTAAMTTTMVVMVTTWSWALLEKSPVVQPLKNFPTFYEPEGSLSTTSLV